MKLLPEKSKVAIERGYPDQVARNTKTVIVSSKELNDIEKTIDRISSKDLKRELKENFIGKKLEVTGVESGKKVYRVDINAKGLGETVSRAAIKPDEIVALNKLDEIITNAKYVAAYQIKRGEEVS